ncbi:Gfo/Idh/MocA family protein [Halocatena halophila]|uniref:Gfo/Idh/MocA family protein n=1 Tax=Halocatena halophila TaxID=2814576 RepID=UPI002ED5EE29
MTVNLAFIGAGGIASTHLEHLRSHEGAAVVAVCDINETVAQTAAQPHDAAVFTDHRAMYEQCSFDAVVIAVPPFAHTDQERLAGEAGVDCFVEKPLGLDATTVRERARTLAEVNVITQVGHMTRYADSLERARALIGERTVSLVDAHWWCGVPGDEDHWWRSKDHSGGQVIEQATHTYDVVRQFAGDVTSVSAVGGNAVNTEALDFEDSTAAVLEHETGTISQVSATSTASEFSHTVRLAGDGFALTLDLGDDRLTGTIGGESIAFQGNGEMYAKELDAFVEAVETRDQSLCRSPYDDALATFETTIAVDQALRTGEPQEVAK